MASITLADGRISKVPHLLGRDIRIAEIARSLGRIPRWLGHTTVAYSVAQHSAMVARILQGLGADPCVVLGGLMHDSAEAFFGDLPSEVKQLFGRRVRWFERCVMRAIEKGLELPVMSKGERGLIKTADRLAGHWEAVNLFPHKPDWARPKAARLVEKLIGRAPMPEFRALYFALREEIYG